MSKEDRSCLSSLPTVTIAIPTYNEAENIENLINYFINNSYKNINQILIADGGSTDGTQDLVKKIALKNSQVKLINNRAKIQSNALNLMLDAAQADIFLRADAHCEYASDYVEKCIQTLLTTQAINVGGAQRFVAKKSFQAGVALAAKSLLGNGGAKYRNPQYNGYADTVFLGCMWTKTLRQLSGYSNQVTNEDAELNQRLLNKNSEAIYVSSKIKVWYYPRKTWKSLWIQYFKYGRGRYFTSIMHPDRVQLRGKLPFLFILTVIVLSLLDLFFSNFNLHLREIILVGLLIPFIESFRVNWKLKDRFATEIWRGESEKIPLLLIRWFYTSIAILTMPLAHFSGYGYQLCKHRILRIQGW
jgi:glycosyltransferase involved in cell wall biosynthesis